MRFALCFPLLLLHGCASAPPVSLFDRAPEAAVRIVPLASGPATNQAASPETQRALAAATRQLGQTQRSLPRYRESDLLLQQAREAAAEGNNPRAQSLARQAAARAEGALEAQRTREAARLLQALYNTTGLSDTQLAQLRAAETRLLRGETLAAVRALKSIKAKAAQPRHYTVRRGDTLSGIASRESVYGNSLLWPLIWQSNRATLPDPDRLRPGQNLKIRPSPSIEEVVQAIQTARQYPSRVKIGRVKTLQ